MAEEKKSTEELEDDPNTGTETGAEGTAGKAGTDAGSAKTGSDDKGLSLIHI